MKSDLSTTLLAFTVAFAALSFIASVTSIVLRVRGNEHDPDDLERMTLEEVLESQGEHLEDSTIRAIMEWHFEAAPICVDPE